MRKQCSWFDILAADEEPESSAAASGSGGGGMGADSSAHVSDDEHEFHLGLCRAGAAESAGISGGAVTDSGSAAHVSEDEDEFHMALLRAPEWYKLRSSGAASSSGTVAPSPSPPPDVSVAEIATAVAPLGVSATASAESVAAAAVAVSIPASTSPSILLCMERINRLRGNPIFELGFLANLFTLSDDQLFEHARSSIESLRARVKVCAFKIGVCSIPYDRYYGKRYGYKLWGYSTFSVLVQGQPDTCDRLERRLVPHFRGAVGVQNAPSSKGGENIPKTFPCFVYCVTACADGGPNCTFIPNGPLAQPVGKKAKVRYHM
jgi:hypothetical protein